MAAITKKTTKLCVLAATAAAALLVTGLAVNAGLGRSTDIAAGARQSEHLTAVTAPQQGGYIIRSYNGRVAVFTDGSTPAVETDIDVNMLRAYDRRLLERGIEVSTYEDALRLLEDFGS